LAAPTPAHAPRIVPPVPQFELPTHALEQLADGAGLQWVQSDVDKVRSVQQAIAAEAPPAHVPRERKPMVLADDGPLVLVETRKDLSQLGLPFERQAAAPAQPPQ
jgi:ribonuclease E